MSGDENGELVLRDLLTLEKLHSLPLHLPIQAICLVARNTHALVPLRDGKLIIIGSKHHWTLCAVLFCQLAISSAAILSGP
jgi:hypothetical protein